ncbi:MAG: FtsK/SpoIIIE domain-containing protein [Bacillaceae bacterium]
MMIEWLIPLGILGAGLVPKGKKTDEKKINLVFENLGIGIKKGDKILYPNMVNKEMDEEKAVYIYTLPIGLKSDTCKDLPIGEALNKEVDISFDGVLRIAVYNKEIPSKWKYDETLLKPHTWLIPVGKNHEGILYHDFDKYPHMLCGGATRYGKTVFLKNTFYSLLMNQMENVEFYILDLKGGLEFGKYAGLPQVKGVASDLYEAGEMLYEISERIDQLKKTFRKNGFTNVVDTPIKKRTFIIVDEGAELSPIIIKNKNDKPIANHCQAVLSEIARIGGGLGMRLIYCTQYPVKDTVPMQVKMNIVARVSFLATATVGSMVILDETGAEDLPTIPGRGIYKVDKSRVIQAPYINDKYMHKQMGERNNEITRESGKPVNDY